MPPSARLSDIADAFVRRWFATRVRGTKEELEEDALNCLRNFIETTPETPVRVPDEDEIALPEDETTRATGRVDRRGRIETFADLGLGEDVDALPRTARETRARRAKRSEDGRSWSFDDPSGCDRAYVALDDLMRGYAEGCLMARVARAKARRGREDAEAELERANARRAEIAAGRAHAPRLCEPKREGARELLKKVYEELTRPNNGSGTVWHPTFGKARKAVQAVARDASDEETLSALTEYVMLYLGGSKHRAKCFEIHDGDDGHGDANEDGDDDDEVDEGKTSTGKRKANSDPGAADDDEEEDEMAEALPDPPVNDRRDDSNGVTLRIVEPWEGRMRAPAEGVEDAREPSYAFSRFLPWWEELDTKDTRAVGRWGEKLVYQYLLSSSSIRQGNHNLVEWLNEKEETNSFYDIKVTDCKSGRVTFVEVKTTRFDDKNAFEISPWEWDFATKPGVQYYIYRVYNAGDKSKVRVQVVRNPAAAVREHKVKMALVI